MAGDVRNGVSNMASNTENEAKADVTNDSYTANRTNATTRNND